MDMKSDSRYGKLHWRLLKVADFIIYTLEFSTTRHKEYFNRSLHDNVQYTTIGEGGAVLSHGVVLGEEEETIWID